MNNKGDYRRLYTCLYNQYVGNAVCQIYINNIIIIIINKMFYINIKHGQTCSTSAIFSEIKLNNLIYSREIHCLY